MLMVLLSLMAFSWVRGLSKTNNKPAPRLIHNRPGPVRCENAWYRSVTSQQRAGPEKRRLWVSRELNPSGSSAQRLSLWFW